MELPALSELRLIVQRYADVVAALELEREEQPLVLPNGEWFPDHFTFDQPSLERLVARLQGYAGLEEVRIDTALEGEVEGGSCGPSGCGTGGCAPKSVQNGQFRISPSGDGYLISVPAQALGNSLALTTSLATMMGLIRLVRAGYEKTDAVVAELAAVALGFGVLLLESSHVYQKSCGGPNISKITTLGCGQLALPFALFAAVEGHSLRAAVAELSPTQRELVNEAEALAASNRDLITKLAESPERVARGNFKLGEARSWLSRLFSSKKKAGAATLDEAALEALERGDDVEEIAALYAKPAPKTNPRATATDKDDELRALVDEALDELRADGAGNGRSAAE
jgi:hypothetical protein